MGKILQGIVVETTLDPSNRDQHQMYQPQINLLLHWVGRLVIWLSGWKVGAEPLPGKKFILIGAPHTSNLDFVIMLATSFVLRLKLYWMGKHTLFRPPFGWFARRLGGLPIDRTAQHGVVEQIAQQMKVAEELILVVAPAGTRKYTDHWKSGFYWIAVKAEVPIVCGYIDYRRQQAGIGLSLRPNGDVSKDMDQIRAFYKGFEGRFPHAQTMIRLQEENPQSSSSV